MEEKGLEIMMLKENVKLTWNFLICYFSIWGSFIIWVCFFLSFSFGLVFFGIALVLDI